jgi:hypothetical protein
MNAVGTSSAVVKRPAGVFNVTSNRSVMRRFSDPP